MNREPRGRVLRALTGAVIILTASLGSVLAANIAIGNSGEVNEFGQGVFTLKACDSWIQMDLVNGATGQNGAPSGLSALTGITIQGLDASKCKSTRFTIRAIDSANKVLPIYRTDRKSRMCTVSPICVIGKTAESDLVIDVSSRSSVSLSDSDDDHNMSYNSSTGIYTISFDQPGQLARDISNLTIQSASV
jgi:hypothetical protein